MSNRTLAALAAATLTALVAGLAALFGAGGDR